MKQDSLMADDRMLPEINYLQEVEMTYDEQVKMYSRCKKKKLIAMLIECNRIIKLIKPTITP